MVAPLHPDLRANPEFIEIDEQTAGLFRIVGAPRLDETKRKHPILLNRIKKF